MIDISILKEKNLLLVDDEEIIREMMKKMLLKRFKEVYTAENGEEAIDIYSKKDIDIVLTDIEMPIMNGLTLLNRIKEINPKEPVIIVTAFEDEAHEAKNADAIVIKPIQRNLLLETIVKVLKS